MLWTRQELKARGRAAFKANFWNTVAVSFILTLLGGGTLGSVAGRARSDAQNLNFDFNNMTPEMQKQTMIILAAIAVAVAGSVMLFKVLDVLLLNPLEVGCQAFFIRNMDGYGRIGDLKEGFNGWGNKLVTMLLRDVFLALWSCLLIIPGIIKYYSYLMVPYILADDPSMGGTEAITLSRQMMNGHKWNAFVLDLSFLGWDILSALTCGILGFFYVGPYKYCTKAELYRAIKG